jgi:serine/threonine protein phosphatase PrpC
MTRAPAGQPVTASLTDVGRLRSNNQDRCAEFVDQAGYRLLIVADGMGGHQGGEVASQTVVETVGEVFRRGFADPAGLLREAFDEANDRVHGMAARSAALNGMGTTGVALLLGPARRAWLANVGDSRAYRIRRGRFELLTDDHSWVNQEVRHQRMTPEEAAVHPRKNVLTRSIGVDPSVEVDVTATDVEPGDRFLLCSDGLWGEVPEPRIAEVLSSEAPERAVHTLVALANQSGGPDNITVQIASLPTGPGASAAPSPDAASGVRSQGLRGPGRRRILTATIAAVTGLLALTLIWMLVAGTRVESTLPTDRPPGGATP